MELQQTKESKVEEEIVFIDGEGGKYTVKDIVGVFKESTRAGRAMIVRYLLNKYKFLTLDDNNEIFYYENGIYRKGAEALIGRETQKILGDVFNNLTNVIEIIGHLKRQTYIKREEFKEPLNLICLENGLFNVGTMQLESYNPEFIFLNKIPVNYNPNIKCSKIDKFLSEVMNKRDIITFQEFLGYFLYKKQKFHKSIMLVGSGANGKSTLISLIKRFLGRENVASEPLQRLEEDPFAVAELFGKLANLVDELPKSALKETSKFKQLTGGDTISAQFKFKNPCDVLCRLKATASLRRMMLFLILNIFQCSFKVTPTSCTKISFIPKMPSWISQPQVRA